MSTKSPHTGSGDSGQPCAASVEYKNVQGACRRTGKYPDPDGIRWWCGLHNPARKKAEKAEKVEVVRTTASVSVKPDAGPKLKPVPAGDLQDSARKAVDADVLLSISQSQAASSQALETLQRAQAALVEISNTNTVGWGETVPVENYKVLITHMADRARETAAEVTEMINQLKG
jgi:hypothetical protein